MQQESNVNYVDVGIIIVVETSRLIWLREWSGAVMSVRLRGFEGYRRICKTRCDKLMNWRLGTGSWKRSYYWCEQRRGIHCLHSKRLPSAWWLVTLWCAIVQQNTLIWWWSAFRGLEPNSYTEW
jgi:hypothetical protein